MNAKELADSLDSASSDMEYNYVVQDWKLLSDSAEMLRQQADRIKELEKYVGFKDSGYDIISANAPRELSDEEIKAIELQISEGVACYDDFDFVEFAREILKKASYK
jgi:hypothetical protein